MVKIGKAHGRRTAAVITNMDLPLGHAIGNALEVEEAINTLKGNGPDDLTALCVELAVQILVLAEKGSEEFCRSEVLRVLRSGEALEKLADMVEAQGGERACVYEPSRLPQATQRLTVNAPETGYIQSVDAEGYGVAALLLGAGRNTKEDVIDMTAGIRLHAKTGDWVEKGCPIATLYSSRSEVLESAREKLLKSTQIGSTLPKKRPLIFEIVE